MTNIAQLGLAIDSSQAVTAKNNLAAIVPAAAATERATASMGAAAASATAKVAGAASAVSRMILPVSSATNAFRLNTQQMQNMAFQMNDMATMLASGQSPFVMMMQQGMQIAQTFGPGVGVSAALRATGSALVSFVTNPLNLAVVALAAASGAVGELWSAVSNSAGADDALKRHKDLIDRIREGYEGADSVVKAFVRDMKDADLYALNRDISALSNTLQGQLATAFSDLGGYGTRFSHSMQVGTATFGALTDQANRLRDAIAHGSLPQVQAIADEITKMANADPADSALQKVASRLLSIGDAALETEGKLTQARMLRAMLLGRIGTEDRSTVDHVFEGDDTARTFAAAPRVTRNSGAVSEISTSFRTIEQAQQAWDRSLRSSISLTQGFFSDLRSSLAGGASFVDSLTSAFGRLETKLLDMVMNQAIDALFSSLLGSTSSYGAGRIGSAVMSAGLYHSGRGPGETTVMRYVHPAYFDHAPRYHSGIGPGEQAAIIRDDESVLTPAQMRALAPAGRGGSVVNVKVENHTPAKVTTTEQRNPDGTVNIRILVADAVAAEIHSGESKINRALETNYGVRRQL